MIWVSPIQVSRTRQIHPRISPGLIQSDVKPDNILLNFRDDGTGVAEAKLADCGT
jgi:hypothetical protein